MRIHNNPSLTALTNMLIAPVDHVSEVYVAALFVEFIRLVAPTQIHDGPAVSFASRSVKERILGK